jgi:4-deoxy-L-threo-5-hexosulose-uronate ketol-isomerase
MTVNCTSRHATHPADYARYDMQQLKDHYLVNGLFRDDEINFVYTHYDRLMVGGAKPVNGGLKLDTIDLLKAPYFLERRELGAINVGGPGYVEVDGERYELGYKDALYVGAGNENVVFHSADAAKPAKYYLNSAPAHTAYPTKRITLADADKMALGAPETSNERVINKLIVNSVLDSCQLQMGMTELKTGSVWNTMPAHTHDRRMEAYFYFELPEGNAVCHFMGPKDETRHVWLLNEQAVVSPPWGIHSGAGTSNYTFIWGMAGENLDYADMDTIHPTDFGEPEA